MRAIGDVETDGSFALYTLVDGHRQSGAIEGPHSATFLPFHPQDHSALPVRLKKTYTVEPKENHFSLSLADAAGG